MPSDGLQRARQRSGAQTETFVSALNAVCEARGLARLRKRPALDETIDTGTRMVWR
jgi:hypothetical protein